LLLSGLITGEAMALTPLPRRPERRHFDPTADSGLYASPLHVMAGLVPAIHVFLCRRAPESKTRMPATSAGMTTERLTRFERKSM
jgi:hypothetical protein